MADISRKIIVFIRLDANHHVGLGHAARMAQLLGEVKNPIEAHIFGIGDQLGIFFHNGEILHRQTQEKSEAERAAEFIALAQEHQADILMIDQHDQTPGTWDAYARSAIPVISIDDYGGNVQANLIINGTILHKYHHYPMMDDLSSVYCGAEYALINPVFGKVNWSETTDNSLLIVIGGGARAVQWAFALTGAKSPFAEAAYDRITMVIGGSFPESDKLRAPCENLGIRLLQNISQNTLANLLGEHSQALITGGMIVYETLASGCPAIIFPQEQNLVQEAEFFAEKNAAINLGYEGGMDMTKVTQALHKPIKNTAIPIIDGPIIDGQGILRAAKIIDQFIEKGKQT